MIIQKSFIFIISLILILCTASIDLISAQTETDSLHKEIKNLKRAISKLDSTINKLQNENQTVIALTEKDINTAQNLINVSQTVTEIIAVMLAIFSVAGGILISRLMKQSRLVRKEHRILKKDWDSSRKEIEKIKETLLKEGKELIQILFYITEGDNRLYEKTEESLEFYKEALKIRDDNPQVYAKLGQAYFYLEEYNDAIINYQKGFQISPNNLSILNGLARIYLDLKQYEKAEDFYNKALVSDQNDNRALWGLGHLYLLKREFDKAELYYKKSQITDHVFFSNFNLAFIYACKKETDRYLDFSEKALQWIENKFSGKAIPEWVLWRKSLIMVILKKYKEAREIILILKEKYSDSSAWCHTFERLEILKDIYDNNNIDALIKEFENKK